MDIKLLLLLIHQMAALVKACVGGGMHCPSTLSSFFIYHRICDIIEGMLLPSSWLLTSVQSGHLVCKNKCIGIQRE